MNSPEDDPIILTLGDNVLYLLTLARGSHLLVDAGPDMAVGDTRSWSLLLQVLAARQIRPADVSHVLITHAHHDHAGLARRWAEIGSRIVAGSGDVAAIRQGHVWRDAQREAQLADLVRHGCPPDLLPRMRSPRSRTLRWEPCPGGSVTEARESYDLAGGLTLQVIPAPGHTPGNVVALIPERGALFSGDTILPTTVPTAGMHYTGAVGGSPAVRWPSLPPFIDSIARLRELEISRIYPGHGEQVAEPSRLFERFAIHHERRARRIRALLAAQPDTAFGVARRQFPRIPPRRLAQAVTETLGHLDLLERDGMLESRERGGIVRHRLTGGAGAP